MQLQKRTTFGACIQYIQHPKSSCLDGNKLIQMQCSGFCMVLKQCTHLKTQTNYASCDDHALLKRLEDIVCTNFLLILSYYISSVLVLSFSTWQQYFLPKSLSHFQCSIISVIIIFTYLSTILSWEVSCYLQHIMTRCKQSQHLATSLESALKAVLCGQKIANLPKMYPNNPLKG